MALDSIDFAALTDVGRKREHNEDNFLVDKKLSLFVVCDGMGGHAAGEVASALAVRTVHDEVKKEKELIDDYLAGKKGGDLVTRRDILNMLEFAVNRASSRVHAEAAKDEKKRGMGTTIVGVLFVGTQAFIVHVGDSRLYLLRDGVLEQVTEDHNVYNELLKRKKMTREQIEKLAPKNAITRAVGVYEHCEPDSLVLDVTDGDRFLLCSDGLSQYFEEDLEGLAAGLGDPDAEGAIRKLIDTANERGGSDNITAILVTVGAAGARDDDRAKRLQLKRDTLARMPLFRPLNDLEILRVLQVTDVVPYKDADTVITQGERGEELYIVLSGTVDVLRGDAKLTSLSPGEHFGEMALIRAQPRSATVKSSGDSELMVLRRSDFFEILRTEHQLAVKLLWQFLGVLADRLADTSRELGEAREELAAEDVTQEIFFSEDDEDRQTSKLPPPTPFPPSTASLTGSARHLVAVSVVWASGSLAACQRREPEPSPTEDRPAVARPAASAPSAASVSTEETPRAAKEPAREGTDVGSGVVLTPATACRAITVRGTVVDATGAAVRSGAVLDRPVWLTVEKGGEIAIKHAATARELVFRGPAHFLPCDRGEERYLMTQGHVQTSTWAGARPGAEVLVATPFAVVRYGDAKLDADVDTHGVAVRTAAGDAWLDAPEPDAAEVRIGPGKQGAKKGPALDVKAIVDLCVVAADASEARARAVLSRPATTGASGAGSTVPLGVRAAEHVRARHAARSACAVAAASLENAEKGPTKDELSRMVLRAEARWRGVP